MSVRILIVDDHAIVRMGIRRFLEREVWTEVVAEVANGFQALAIIPVIQPDVILLDIEMPGLNGIDVIRSLQDDEIRSHVLVFSAHNDPEYTRQVLSTGCGGYLLKDEVPEKLTEAVWKIAQGETIQQGVQVEQDTGSIPILPQKQKAVTLREMEVLRGVVDGKDNRSIARDLCINEKTVEKRLRNAFHKLGVRTRVEAAVFAVRSGWF